MSLLEQGVARMSMRVMERSGDFSAPAIELELAGALRILPGRREVYSGRLQDLGLEVVAKRFLAHAKQARDWRREWDGLLALQGLSLSAPVPLCVVEESDSAAVWVVMQRIEHATSVAAAFQQADAGTRETMMSRLVELVDAAHHQGVWQGDQHIDNWTWDGSRFYLLDAGTIHFEGQALQLSRRLKDLAGICVTLAPEAEQLFRGSLQSAYLAGDQVQQQRMLQALEATIVRHQHQRTRRYYKKTRRNCTEFSRTDGPRYHSIHRRGADPELIERFISDPEALMNEGVCLKDGNTCTVQGFSFASKPYVLKRYNQKPLLDRLRRACSDSRALKSWSHAWVLEMAFIPTARSVAVCEDRQQRLSGNRYLLMERIEGQLLTDYVERCAGDADRIAAVAMAFAQLWGSLGRLRAAHGDLKATNLIVGDDGRLYLFDLDAFRFGLGATAFKRGRQRDWNRFFKNWNQHPELAGVFKQAIERFKSA
jgi:tRNA A-37 threonylcarbamoyl transferase component Bud32